MLLSQYKPLAQKAYCAAIVLLLILSEVFSSNIQAALPTFSSLTRLALTGGAVALLGVKIFLLTDYEARWQPRVRRHHGHFLTLCGRGRGAGAGLHGFCHLVRR